MDENNIFFLILLAWCISAVSRARRISSTFMVQIQNYFRNKLMKIIVKEFAGLIRT